MSPVGLVAYHEVRVCLQLTSDLHNKSSSRCCCSKMRMTRMHASRKKPHITRVVLSIRCDLLQAEMTNKESHIKVSLRSTEGFDTSAVSEAFGGGGHAAASSCIITHDELGAWRAMAQ
jgi:hypothetical protein